MKTLWKWSTGFFGLQILVGGATHLLGGSPKTVVFVAATAPLFVVLFVAALAICALSVRDFESLSASVFRALVALIATSAAFSAMGASALTSAPAMLPVAGKVFVFAVFSIKSAMLAAAFAAMFASKEKFVVLFLSALPLGIGTVRGGTILLLRRCCAAKNVAA